MNELIKVNYDNDRPTILGRDLHEFAITQHGLKECANMILLRI